MNINLNTKKATAIIDEYNYYSRRGYSELYQVYNNYSHYKAAALEHCKALKAKYHGANGCIGGANCMQFSYYFDYVDDNDGTYHVVKITKDNIYNVG